MKRKGNRPEGWRISFAAHKEVIQKYRNRWILCIMLLFTLTAGCGSSVSGTGTAPAGTSPSLTQEASDAAASSSAAQTDAALPGEYAVPRSETTSQLAGSADPDSLFSGADLEGFFIETADGGFRVSVVTKTYDKTTGLIEVSSGDEEAAVSYSSPTLFQRLEMDRATQTMNSLKNISASDLSKDDNLLIFGTQNNNRWQADRVIAVLWK